MSEEQLTELKAKYDEILGAEGKPIVDDSLAEDEESDSIDDPREPKVEEVDEVEEEEIEEQKEEASEEASEAEVDEDEYEDIPDDDVLSFIKKRPDLLEKLGIGGSTEEAVQKVQEPVKPTETPGIKKVEAFDVSEEQLDDMDPSTRTVFEKFLESDKQKTETLNQVLESVQENKQFTAQQQADKAVEFNRSIDSHFDAIKDLDGVGKSSEGLNQTHLSVRKEIFNIASVLDGTTWGDKIDKAVKAYKGLHGETGSVETLRRKVNKTKTKFSARPGGQRAKRTFKNEKERVFSKMDEIAADIGIKWSN